MSKAVPKRIRWAAQHYACYLETCNAHHDATYIREDLATCTPEERAVIDAAVADRLAIRGDVDTNAKLDRSIRTRAAFNKAIDQLLATRSKSEVSK